MASPSEQLLKRRLRKLARRARRVVNDDYRPFDQLSARPAIRGVRDLLYDMQVRPPTSYGAEEERIARRLADLVRSAAEPGRGNGHPEAEPPQGRT